MKTHNFSFLRYFFFLRPSVFPSVLSFFAVFIVFLLYFGALSPSLSPLSAETDTFGDTNENVDIDSLFEDPGSGGKQAEGSEEEAPETSTEETEEETAKDTEKDDEQDNEDENEKEPQPDLLNEVVKKEGLNLSGNFSFSLGYSGGFNYGFWDTGYLDSIDYVDGGLLQMSSALSLTFRISPEFSVYQRYTLGLPDFLPKVAEFYGDITFSDMVYVKIGRQRVSWGISPNFPFTNLPARLPDDFSGDTGSYGVKITLPLGVGGIELLGHTRNGYLADPKNPAIDALGVGLKGNLALENFDFTLGTFYHKQLHYRVFGSLKTTLFGFLELYSEGLLSFDLDGLSGGSAETGTEELVQTDASGTLKVDNPFDMAFGAGFYVDFFSGALKINGEYFYSGEETETDGAGFSNPLYFGHNLAWNTSLQYGNGHLLFLQGKATVSYRSVQLVPGTTVKILPNFQLYLAIPMVFGSHNYAYHTDGPNPQNRRLSFVIAARYSGDFK